MAKSIQGSNFKRVKIGTYYLWSFTLSNQVVKVSDANSKFTLGFIGEGFVDHKYTALIFRVPTFYAKVF